MNGPDHYRDAEGALEAVRDSGSQLTDAEVATLVAIAQVHATLAQVAVQVDMAENLHGMGKKWAEVAR